MRILVFQHAAIETPGIFRKFWREAGHQLTTVQLDEDESIPPLDAFDLMVDMGGTVGKMQRPEVGLAPIMLTPEGLRDPVLAGFTNPVESFHWHGAGVSEPPADAVVLAGNEACPVQAIRFGRNAYGFQYHCEIEATTVEDWSTIPAYHASLMKALGEDGAARLPHELLERLPAFHARAERLNANLMDLIATTTA